MAGFPDLLKKHRVNSRQSLPATSCNPTPQSCIQTGNSVNSRRCIQGRAASIQGAAFQLHRAACAEQRQFTTLRSRRSSVNPKSCSQTPQSCIQGGAVSIPASCHSSHQTVIPHTSSRPDRGGVGDGFCCAVLSASSVMSRCAS